LELVIWSVWVICLGKRVKSKFVVFKAKLYIYPLKAANKTTRNVIYLDPNEIIFYCRGCNSRPRLNTNCSVSKWELMRTPVLEHSVLQRPDESFCYVRALIIHKSWEISHANSRYIRDGSCSLKHWSIEDESSLNPRVAWDLTRVGWCSQLSSTLMQTLASQLSCKLSPLNSHANSRFSTLMQTLASQLSSTLMQTLAFQLSCKL
jgi:hypothetical protein